MVIVEENRGYAATLGACAADPVPLLARRRLRIAHLVVCDLASERTELPGARQRQHAGDQFGLHP